jgi:protein O-GlcNAc transferase
VAAGIDAARLRFIDRVPDRAAHLALYDEIDIGLDPFPYNGTTTTCEALWMGVPVLTKRGDSFVSRVGESLLQSMGLQAWIAQDTDDYVARASKLAADLDGLALLRSTLRDRFAHSPLGDAERFARNFEAALRGMWTRWCEQQSPKT